VFRAILANASSAWWLALSLLLAHVASCGAPLPSPTTTNMSAPAVSLPNWCEAVDAALDAQGQNRDFRCLRVPNFLVTGFYGTRHNPERSDFVNGCFGGVADAAARLRLAVRPAGQLGFSFRAERTVAADGSLDLGFVGPWAPRLQASTARGETLSVDVELVDAELRVLPSVAEILGQEHAKNATEPLEACLGALCDPNAREPLFYTAKVLAAIPVISVRRERSARSSVAVALGAGSAQFELGESERERGLFTIRAREKLNVAALLEEARPALERALTCTELADSRVRREVVGALRELGLRVLADRELEAAPQHGAALREAMRKSPGAFSASEQGDLMKLLEALEGASRELTRRPPGRALCATQSLLEAVLGGGGTDHRLRDTVTEVAQPLQRRLTELANEQALPCAEPVWYRDEDGDAFGDQKRALRAAKQPHGYVANSHDCFDRSRDARPGQVKYFSRQRGDGSFDYDCDGKATPLATALASGCKSISRFGIPIRCWAEAGWRDRVPACGTDARWLASCTSSTFSCEEGETEIQQQVCR
jgi:hypothetical protein